MASPKVMPRGIQKIERTNKNGSKVVKYRVQIKSTTFTCDRLFDEYEEAHEFFLVSKSQTGRGHINLLEQDRLNKKNDFIDLRIKSPDFKTYTVKYLERYIRPKYQQWLSVEKMKTPEGKFKLRQMRAEQCFFNTICSTRIRPWDKDKAEKTITHPTTGEELKFNHLLFKPKKAYQDFGALKPYEITEFEINQYITERLKTVRPSTVEAELGKMSNVFKKIRYLNPDLTNLANPVLLADKDLIKAYKKNLPPTRTIKRLSDSDRVKMFEALNLRENKELYNGIRFMLYTGLRRSEMVLLLRSNCFSNYLHLPNNKSDKPRTVYLIQEAQAIANEQKAFEYADGRLFSFVSVASFASQFKKCMKKAGLEHIKPHLLRKEFISRMVEELGRQNSLVLATILGNDVSHLERVISTLAIDTPIQDQKDLLRQVGHTDPRITQQHYLELNLKND